MREGGKNRAAYLYASMAAVLRLMCLLPIYGRWFKINVSIGSLYSSGFMFYVSLYSKTRLISVTKRLGRTSFCHMDSINAAVITCFSCSGC